jgi:hypothetical protein
MVHVASGTYPGGFFTKTSGTATARISYVSDVRGGARIVPPANSTGTVAWWNTGNYIDIIGFDVDGTNHISGQKWYTGIVTQGSYTLVKYNYAHNIATTADTCTANGGSGINTDNSVGGANNEVTGNVIHHIGSTACGSIHGIYAVSSGTVKNNVVYQIGHSGIVSWHAASGITVVNNTIYNAMYGIQVGGDLPDNFKIANNIVVGTRMGIIEESGSGKYGKNIFTNNLVYQSAVANYALANVQTGGISVDPQFNNASGGDFRLKSTSPAISKALASYAPSDDLVGTPRPTGAGIELGAIEFKG